MSVGNWNMVDDQGFEIRYKEFVMFMFSKYEFNQDEYTSRCDETLVGWYNDKRNQ